MTPFPEKIDKKQKRVLPLYVFSPYSVNQYVVFKEKNKNNLSPIYIRHGEVGQIIKKLEKWDQALVDFSIEVPSRFQQLKLKFIADQASTEVILLEERV